MLHRPSWDSLRALLQIAEDLAAGSSLKWRMRIFSVLLQCVHVQEKKTKNMTMITASYLIDIKCTCILLMMDSFLVPLLIIADELEHSMTYARIRDVQYFRLQSTVSHVTL